MDTLIQMLKATAERSRLRIMSICMHGELSVSDLTHILGQSQPRVSRHLKVLCESGLLNRFQEGTWVFYRLPDEAGSSAHAFLQKFSSVIPKNDPQLARDLVRLADVRRARQDVANTYFQENAGQWDEIRRMYVDDVKVEEKLLAVLPHDNDKNLIDIGTGTGRILELLGRKVAQSVGIDCSREMLSIARSRLDALNIHGCQVRQGDMYQLPIDDGGFDIAMLHLVLHYSEEPSAVIEEATRVLVAGGVLAIVDFAPHRMEVLRERHAHRRLGFGDDEIADLFLQNGLRTSGIHSLPGKPLTVKIWIGEKLDDDRTTDLRSSP